MSSEELLSSVRHALEVGNKVAARTLLVQMVKSGQANGETWHLMEQVVDDPAQKADCARRAAAAGWVEPEPTPKVELAAAPLDTPALSTSPVVASSPVQPITSPTPSRLASIPPPTAPAEPVPPLIVEQVKPRSRPVGFVAMVLAILLLAALAGGVFLQRRSESQQVAGATSPTDIPIASAPKAPSAKPQPSRTSGPTKTPAPTRTPAPTKTPEPTATEAPPPEPVVVSGRGQQVTDLITLPAGVSRVKVTHTGQRNFIVKLLRNDDEDLLVNDIGSYSGVRPVIGDGDIFFEIQADGAWTLELEAIPFDPSAATSISGSGDYVSGLFMPTQIAPVPMQISHSGKRNFIVHLYCAGGDDLVQNAIGTVSGSTLARFSKGPCIWDVQADGDWFIKPRQ